MIYTPMTKKAMLIAYQAHKNQVDKAGVPYIFHPIHIAEKMTDETTCTIALLHDVIEDSNITFSELQPHFPEDILDALKRLTKNKDQDYFDYIKSIKENKLATIVKLADLEHNMDITRLSTIDSERLHKYKKAKDLLTK